MMVVHGSSALSLSRDASVTVGNFDGVHRGHRELLRRTVGHAAEAGLVSVVMTFTPHPVRHFSPSSPFYEISTPEEKAELVASAGVDVLVVEPFGGGTGRMAPEEFVERILCGRLRARFLTVGYDFTFGRNRSGSPAMLGELGSRLGFRVDVVPPLYRAGGIVSSSRIRELLLAGRVREAGELLCRPYRMTGPVVTGAGRGRKLGFPTANVRFAQELIPLPGVYVVDAEVEGERRRGVANVGFNPTFGDNSLGLEVHLPDYAGDLYGKDMRVDFLDRVRDERKFESVEALVRQIRQDVQYALEWGARTPADARGTDASGGGGREGAG